MSHPDDCLYGPLDHGDFRLLTLLPTDADFEAKTLVRCNLSTHTLDDRTATYDALSYCWGDRSKLRSVLVNGRTVSVTDNLWDALIHLRTDESRVLWVDAICINQQDDLERTYQVGRMSTIYSQAALVHVWLGRTTLATPNWYFKEHENSEEQLLEAFIQRVGRREKTGEVGATAEDIEQDFARLSSFFYRPWFERMWVVQEVLLAKRVSFHWGDVVMTLGTVRKAARFVLEQNPQPNLHHIHRIPNFDFLSLDLGEGIEEYSFLKILTMCRGRGCSDPKDRIFALLGLYPGSYSLEARYTDGVEKIYCDNAFVVMRDSSSLDVLTHACGFLNLDDFERYDGDVFRGPNVLPSWAPDWRTYFDLLSYNTLVGYAVASECYNAAAGCGGFRIVQRPDFSLEVNGLHVTTLSDTKTVILPTTWPPEENRANGIIRDWKDFWELSTRETLRTILRDAVPRRRFGQNLAIGQIRLTETKLTELEQWLADDPRETRGSQITSSVRASKACKTLSDGIGVVPDHARVGDEVFVLAGSRLPYVLRRAPGHAETSYTLVGPCYIRGIMDGEAVQKAYDALQLSQLEATKADVFTSVRLG